MKGKIQKIIMGVFVVAFAFVLGASVNLHDNTPKKLNAAEWRVDTIDSTWSITVKSGTAYNANFSSHDDDYRATLEYSVGGLSVTSAIKVARGGYYYDSTTLCTVNLTEDHTNAWIYLSISRNHSSLNCYKSNDDHDWVYLNIPASYMLQDSKDEPIALVGNGTWLANKTMFLFPNDTVSPRVSFSMNSGNSYINSRTIPVSGSAYDNISSVTYLLSSSSGFGAAPYAGSSSFTTTSISVTSDGRHCRYLNVKDAFGNTNYGYECVTVDTVAPGLTATGTSTTWTTSSRTITLSGTDDNSGVSGYYCNGSWYSSTASSYSCSFTSSTKTATVGVKDRAGNQTTTTVNVYVDKTAPSGSTTGESTTWTASNRTITIYGSDSHSGVASYYCNGSWKSSTASSYSCTFSTSTKTATVGVKDAAGKSYTFSANVYVDKTAPSWTISGGGNWDGKTYYAKPGVSLIFNFTDNHSGIWNYSSAATYYKWGWSTSSSSYPSSYSTSFSSTTSSKVAFSTTAPTTAGTHYVCVYYVGQDGVSNLTSSNNIYNTFTSSSAYAWFQIVVDSVAPTLTVSTTSTGTKNSSGANTVYYAKSGDSLTVSFSDNNGLYYYNDTAYFRYLWCSNSNYYDYYDCMSTLNDYGYYESVGSSRSKTSVSGSITVPSATTGTYIYLWIEGDASDLAGWTVSNTENYLGAGTTSYEPRIFTFYIDNTNPTSSVTQTSTWKTTYVTDNTSSYIYATFSDSNSGVYSSSVHIMKAGTSSYTSYSYSSGTYIYANSSYLASGLNYVYFSVKDKAGNYVTSSTYSLYLDETNPTVTPSCTGTWCDGSTYVAGNTSNYVKATMSDGHSGLNVTRIYVKQAGASSYTYYSYTSGTSIYSNNSYFTSGVNYVYFYATDNVGRSTTSTTYTLYVDKTNPTVTPSCTGSWCDGATYVAGNTSNYVKATVSDSHSGLNVSRIYVKKAGDSSYTYYSYTSGTSIYSSNSYFTSGVNYVYFYATDNVGHSTTSTTYTLYVDKENPFATTVTTFISEYVDLENSKVYIPFTPKDNHSGVKSVTATNSGTYSSNKLWFPMTSISNKTLSYTYTITDNVGNTKSATVTFDVSLTYDEVLQNKVKTGMANKLDTGKTLTSQNNNKQLKYVMDSDACTILANLSPFGINPNTSTVNTKYIFVSQNLSADLSVYNVLAKPTTLSALQSGIVSPLGQKGSVYLVLLFEDMGVHVASGSIGAAAATALSTNFDTYESAETNYVGAGLGEDGTVVSFSNDATSSMAVTLGASNVIEKRDVYGVLEWEKAITSSGKVELKKVINNEYGILVLGETTSGSINGTSYPLMGGKDILVIRLDKQGNILFTNVIGTSSDDLVIAGDMNDNRIAIISSVNGNEASLITMNVDGTGLNINTLSSTGLELTGVAINANKVVVIGTSKSSTVARNQDAEDIGNVGGKDAFVQLYIDNNLTWVRRLGGVGDDVFYSVSLDNNNIYIVGQAGSAMLHDNLGSTKLLDEYGAKDGMIVKYDYDGNMVQLSSIGGAGDDTFTQLLVTSTNVIVAGLSNSSTITASHYHNNTFNINRLSDMDTVIITMNKDLIIEEGLNLSGDEANLVQEIGINQYTEQLMILSSSGVHTQKVVANKLKFDVVYENGTLKVKANEEIAYATLFDGNEYIEINKGIKIAPGAYEVTVTSTSGVSLTKVVNVNIPVIGSVEEHSILPMISMFISIMTLAVLTVLVIKKYKREIA